MREGEIAVEKGNEFEQPWILRRLLAALTRQDGADNNFKPLKELAGNSTEDPTIALLDAWAMVLNVLAFYQTQNNKESYLNTATELKSVRELIRAIGYELAPGLAASTHLNFIVNADVTIPRGMPVQNIPQGGELTQTFETSDDLLAKPAWNTLKPKIFFKEVSPVITAKQRSLRFAVLNFNLQAGDRLLLLGQVAAKPVAFLLTIQTISVMREAGYTEITWSTDLRDPANSILAEKRALQEDEEIVAPAVYVFRQQVACFGNTAPSGEWDNDNAVTVWHPHSSVKPLLENADLYFDQTVPNLLSDTCLILLADTQQQIYKIRAVYQTALSGYGIQDGGNIRPGTGISARVSAVRLANFITGEALKTEDKPDVFRLRETTVLIGGAALPLYKEFALDATKNNLQHAMLAIEASQAIALPAGKLLVISTISDKLSESVTIKNISADENKKLIIELTTDLQNIYEAGTTYLETTIPNLKILAVDIHKTADACCLVAALDKEKALTSVLQSDIELKLNGAASRQSEVFKINGSSYQDGCIFLSLTNDLKHAYQANNAIIYGNIVAATQGETVQKEVLGSGDASKANQTFTLKKAPLTYLSTNNTKGLQSTLSVKVNKVLWSEVSNLYDVGPAEQCYVIQHDENDKVRVIFGDGMHGARLPSGQENIVVTYRTGIGLSGNLPSNSLTILPSTLPEIRSVNNPVPASGAAAADNFTTAKHKALSSINILNRIVSLHDFEYFARSFAGVEKVQAKTLLLGYGPVLHLTICSQADTEIDENSLLYQSLSQAINAFCNPGRAFYLQGYQPRQFNLHAQLHIDSRYASVEVIEAVRQQLLERFSFAERELGQAVVASEVIQVIQQVAGVLAVSLIALDFKDQSPLQKKNILYAESARFVVNAQGAISFLPAQLLTINVNGIVLEEVRA